MHLVGYRWELLCIVLLACPYLWIFFCSKWSRSNAECRGIQNYECSFVNT